MNHKIGLKTYEKKLVKRKDKRIIIRPDSKEFVSIAKGDLLECDGTKMLVLDVRDYPRLEDLFHVESLDWIAMEVKDAVEGIKKFQEEYTKDIEKGCKFLAIEFSMQGAESYSA